MYIRSAAGLSLSERDAIGMTICTKETASCFYRLFAFGSVQGRARLHVTWSVLPSASISMVVPIQIAFLTLQIASIIHVYNILYIYIVYWFIRTFLDMNFVLYTISMAHTNFVYRAFVKKHMI